MPANTTVHGPVTAFPSASPSAARWNEILEAHGGKIALQSRPAEGTVVTCWLPPR